MSQLTSPHPLGSTVFFRPPDVPQPPTAESKMLQPQDSRTFAPVPPEKTYGRLIAVTFEWGQQRPDYHVMLADGTVQIVPSSACDADNT